MSDQVANTVRSMLAAATSRPERLEALSFWCSNNPQTDDPQVLALVDRVLSEGFLISPEEELHLLTVFEELYGR
jgi:hypothetical protein